LDIQVFELRLEPFLDIQNIIGTLLDIQKLSGLNIIGHPETERPCQIAARTLLDIQKLSGLARLQPG